MVHERLAADYKSRCNVLDNLLGDPSVNSQAADFRQFIGGVFAEIN